MNDKEHIYSKKFLELNNLFYVMEEQNYLKKFKKYVKKEMNYKYSISTIKQYLYPRFDRKYNAPIIRKLALRFLKDLSYKVEKEYKLYLSLKEKYE